jgi:hypothetical protein
MGTIAKTGPIVLHERLENGYAGFTDGQTIWVDDRLNAIQLMCTLMHELVHIERGHGSRQTEDVELSVRYETAHRLVPLDLMAAKCKDSISLKEAARSLSVTRQVLMDRSACLTDTEAEIVGCRDCRKCPAMAFRFREE